MPTETLGLIGIVLWVMVIVAQLRRKSAAGSIKTPPARRSRLHNRSTAARFALGARWA